MRKIRRKWLSILLTLAMLVGLMLPFAGSAAAATTYEAITNVASFNPSSDDQPIKRVPQSRLNSIRM